jgi:hypothetical protein
MGENSKDIKIKENMQGNIEIENLVRQKITSQEQLLEYINRGNE